MSVGECQICGRRLRINVDDAIRAHHYRGVECRGSHHYPVSVSRLRIIETISVLAVRDIQLQEQWQSHRAQRINQPLTAEFWKNWADVVTERQRLTRRLQNVTKGRGH